MGGVACAEIRSDNQPVSADAPSGPLPPQQPPLFEIQCFQDGVKIIDERRSGALSVATASRLIWSNGDDSRFEIFVDGKSLCRVRAVPPAK